MICLYLPRHLAAGHEEDTAAAAGPVPATSGHASILVVDDEPPVRMVAIEILEEPGYSVREAEDGPSALNIFNTRPDIDLLVNDVGLPNGMNGRQVADSVRVQRPDLPALFITGYSENAVLNHGHLDRGMQVMTKPFSGDIFARRVSELLGSE
jgi:CheY-like chemotaxis protein